LLFLLSVINFLELYHQIKKEEKNEKNKKEGKNSFIIYA